MRVAVAYNKGNVNDHFGKAEQFKIYEVEDGKVLDSFIIDAEGEGHSAMTSLMVRNEVSAVVSGNMGPHAWEALGNAGIGAFVGASGTADEAVNAFLQGKLIPANLSDSEGGCGAHDEEGCGGCCGSEDDSCGCGDDDSCGGCGVGCGGCGGHEYVPDFEGPNVGKPVKVNYRGTLDDGTQFDSSYDRGQTLDFICGAGMMIHGFDKAVSTMTVGEKITVHLEPSEAYGEVNPENIITIAIEDLPGSEELSVGEHVYLSNAYGQPVPVLVTAKDETNITMDANHELAGKALNFEIELVEVTE
ncbi:MAG: FKBP-type peptidyl-prolyl cis-trans isomerase [Lachnospiraceae bacterium]|nr:FKBP-type peptidyl-prolyl cis-trans isomerase [Lachnospiraceae bacterium]